MKQLLFILTIISAISAVAAPMEVSETKYDWSTLANNIVEGKSKKYDQAYAIYRWLCDNIAYDTSYTIHDSDNAIEQNKGVCQAYCELFYRLGEAIGLKVDIVGGKSKDRNGDVSPEGHAWVFVYTNDNKGILIDPTWGAGSVDGGTFTRSKDDDSWFHVDPHWAIFSHFPDDESYQLLSTPVDYATFYRLPSYRPDLGYFKFEGKELLQQTLSGKTPDLPECHFNSAIEIIDTPRQGTLRVGQEYKFCVNDLGNYEYAIINGDDYLSNWNISGSQHFCHFVPSQHGFLRLSYRPRGSKDLWTTVMEYKVPAPSGADISALENKAPHKSPVLKGLTNYHPEILKSKGIDFANLLNQVKSENISKLPLITTDGNFKLNSAPMNGVLKAGRTYTFKFSPYEGGDWRIINGSEWLDSWTQNPETRAWELTVTVAPEGKLKLAHRPEGSGGNSYNVYMEYDIQP